MAILGIFRYHKHFRISLQISGKRSACGNFDSDYVESKSFPSGSAVKNLPAMQETHVHSPVGEDPLEEEMATHSSVLAWRIPWTQEPGRLQLKGLQRIGHD